MPLTHHEHGSIKGVFFDFDGTILDSFSSQFKAYQATFRRFKIQITKKEFLRNYSPNWLKTYEAFGLSEHLWKDADEYWLKEVARFPSRFFPRAKRMLLNLRKSYCVGLVTSGSKQRVFNDLRNNKASSLFDVIVTGDDVRRRKPHPEGLLKALKSLKIERNRAIYVGDAFEDLQMARAAHVHFVGIQSLFTTGLPSALPSVGDITKLFKKM